MPPLPLNSGFSQTSWIDESEKFKNLQFFHFAEETMPSLRLRKQ